MGCNSSAPVFEKPIKSNISAVPMQFETSSDYINQFPVIVLGKLKEKFDVHCRERVGEMTFKDFKRLYGHFNLNNVKYVAS